MTNNQPKRLNEKIEHLKNYADFIRKTMLDIKSSFSLGNTSGVFSVVELYIALYMDLLDIDKIVRNDPTRTRIIPKPTSALSFYPTLIAAGIMEEERLQHFGTDKLPLLFYTNIVGIDVTSYTLGTNFSSGVGLALHYTSTTKLIETIGEIK